MNDQLPPAELGDLDATPSDLDTTPAEPEEPTDLDFSDMPCTDDSDGDGDGDDGDESRWEAFVPDEDEWDPEPEVGDFWIENAA
jgi:hypothetical protein